MQCIFYMEVQIMPYCPKCDMEFVEGIKVCSDCGGPLVESKEVAVPSLRQAFILGHNGYA